MNAAQELAARYLHRELGQSPATIARSMERVTAEDVAEFLGLNLPVLPADLRRGRLQSLQNCPRGRDYRRHRQIVAANFGLPVDLRQAPA